MLVKAGLLIDGTGAPPVHNCILAIEHGLIAAVGRETDFACDDVDTAVDYSACCLLPGLIDCHVHLFLEGVADIKVRESRWREPRDVTLLRAAGNLARTLRQGVTAVRDLGGPAAIGATLKKAVGDGVLAGPRILTCHQAISAPGGHFHYAGGREADGPSDVAKAVREQVKAGADVIKLMLTGIVNFRSESAGSPELSLTEVRAAVREAGRFGRTVSVHANGVAGMQTALAAGVRTVEHGALLDETTVDRLAASEAYWVPTLTPFIQMFAYARQEVVASLPPAALERVLDRHAAMVRRAALAGAKIVAGTDAGSLGVNHGEVWQEVAALSEIGLPPLAAIAAATGLAAKACGLEGEAGVIAVGRPADLIVVPGNPLIDIKLLGQVSEVYKNGVARRESRP
jgi:imidazolonepropionase-like amidohydrolase